MTFKNIEHLAIVGILLSFLGFSFFTTQPVNGEIDSSKCTTTTVAAVAVGHEESLQVLATTSNRAYARIEQPLNATNTVAVSFSNGADATLASGFQLANASTTNATYFFEFGRNTDHPYIGPVEVLTSTGSSTVRVTECIY